MSQFLTRNTQLCPSVICGTEMHLWYFNKVAGTYSKPASHCSIESMSSTSSRDRASKAGPRNVIKLINSTILTLLLFKEPVNLSLQPDSELKGKSDNIFLYISINICLNKIKDSKKKKRTVEPTLKSWACLSWGLGTKKQICELQIHISSSPRFQRNLQLIPSALTPSDVFDFFPDRK